LRASDFFLAISDLTAVCTILCTRPRIDLWIYFKLIALILIRPVTIRPSVYEIFVFSFFYRLLPLLIAINVVFLSVQNVDTDLWGYFFWHITLICVLCQRSQIWGNIYFEGHRSEYDVRGHRSGWLITSRLISTDILYHLPIYALHVFFSFFFFLAISDLTAVCTILCTRPRIDLWIYFVNKVSTLYVPEYVCKNTAVINLLLYCQIENN
jgi:hypothetical protein